TTSTASFSMSRTGTSYFPSRRSLTVLVIRLVRQPAASAQPLTSRTRDSKRPSHSLFTASGSSILGSDPAIAIVRSSRSGASLVAISRPEGLLPRLGGKNRVPPVRRHVPVGPGDEATAVQEHFRDHRRRALRSS